MDRAQLAGSQVTVVGAARSGLGAARLLKSAGARVFVTDMSAPERLGDVPGKLRESGIPFETGGHSERAYDATLMVISPGVPSEAPIVREAKNRKIAVVSEIELGWWFAEGPVVAITGTNGKTTTTALTGRVLTDARVPNAVGGNIGEAYSGFVRDMAPGAVAVLEVSSFQLDHIATFRPRVSVLMNITQDHMDRYGNSMERYADSKARVFLNQRDDDVFIYCADDPWTAKTAARAACRILPFSTERTLTDGAWIEGTTLMASTGDGVRPIVEIDEISIKGVHNRYNAMAAALVGLSLGVGPASIRATLKNFKGVEHRLEFVRELDGVRYYNDSKATNVDSVWYALQAFAEPIVLLLGGRDKGNDYSRLHPLVRERVRAVVAIGESAPKVEQAFAGLAVIKRASSMDEAVRMAKFLSERGDVVLLSPACASFDWFQNYEHRGRVFKEAVNAL